MYTVLVFSDSFGNRIRRYTVGMKRWVVDYHKKNPPPGLIFRVAYQVDREPIEHIKVFTPENTHVWTPLK